MEPLGDRDFWFRYHAVDEERRLEADHHFVLRWNEHFEFKLDAGQNEVTLSLVERVSAQTHVLGWWDDARWHPFALRWSELRTLCDAWSQRSDVLTSPFPLLLLGRFVGFGVDEDEARQEAARLVDNAYRSLGFSSDDVAKLVGSSLPVANEEDYQWTHDSELGWLFGGEYPCYSLRNREHRGGEEGRFPFALVRGLFPGSTG